MSQRPEHMKKGRRPILRRERCVAWPTNEPGAFPRMLKVFVPVSEISSAWIFRPKRKALSKVINAKPKTQPRVSLPGTMPGYPCGFQGLGTKRRYESLT